MVKIFKITDIKWEQASDDPVILPTEFEIAVFLPNDCKKNDYDEYVSDAITRQYGYCHNGFNSEEFPITKKLQKFKVICYRNITVSQTGHKTVEAYSANHARKIVQEMSSSEITNWKDNCLLSENQFVCVDVISKSGKKK